MTEIRVVIAGDAHSVPEELAELSFDLERDLRSLEVSELRRPNVSTPPGAKGDALAWAELIVAFSTGLPAILSVVRSWLGRNPEASVTLEIRGDRLILSDVSEEDQRRLMNEWLRRHADE